VTGIPNAVFMGGTLEKAYLALFRRPLKATDFTQLWSVSSAGGGKNMIGTEFSMDISELGRHPISVDKPAGVDIRYDPAFDELQTEVDKLSSPAAAGSVNWEKVCRFASEILMNRSKDLVAAGYLAVSLIYRRRNDGFAMGLNLYLDLLEHFWEELYPSKLRARGRIRAIEWWAEKTEACHSAHRPDSDGYGQTLSGFFSSYLAPTPYQNEEFYLTKTPVDIAITIYN